MRCCSRGPLGRLLGVKTSAEIDRPATTTFMKSLLAPKARHSHQSLGQRPRVMKIKKTLALKARFTSGTPVGSAPIESRFQPRKLSGLPQVRHGESVLWRTVIERRAFSAKHTLLRCPKVLYQFHRRQRKIALTGGLSPCEAARDFICEQQPNQTAKA